MKVIWTVHWLVKVSKRRVRPQPLLRDTALTQLTYSGLFFKYNAPGISEMTRSTFHRTTSCIFFKNGDKKKIRIKPWNRMASRTLTSGSSGGWTTFGSWDVEKVHAVVARTTFGSEHVQDTTCSDRFWTSQCRPAVEKVHATVARNAFLSQKC